MKSSCIIVPKEDRIAGQKYLEKCGHYHTWNPKPDGWSLEGELMGKLAKKMSDEIDQDILGKLLKVKNVL
jgi:hypothetical protein